jgi:hypothetical protein
MYSDISILLDKTIVNINDSSDEIIFTLDNGDKYRMYHQQDCCERVYVEDVIGNFSDLLNSPITKAEESSSSYSSEDSYTCGTWTFYHLATVNGYVTIRWLGTSNGYYSERVDFVKI